MGSGIAQVAALGGFETVLHDPDPEALASGSDRMQAALAKGAGRGRWSAADAASAAGRLTSATDVEELGGCDLVIEAAPERLELKHELFRRLEAACRDDAILATNTSSLSVTAIAGVLEHPQRACGMHFFNPPALMKLVEVVAGEESSEEVLATAEEAARRMGREPVRAADGIGFIGNRVNRPFTLEALKLVGERIASPEQVDRVVRIGGGYRMGPFELMDLVGVDVNLAVARSFYEQSFGEPRWRPHPLQSRLVAAGRLGRKSGRGWYRYDAGPHRPEDPGPPPALASRDAPALDGRADLERDGFRALCVEGTSLAARGGEPRDVGYVALPTLADATLVELTRRESTPDGAAAAAERFFKGLGRHVEWVGDSPGLVLGRLLAQIVNEASFAVGEGVGEPLDVDTAMRLGFNHPRGPFEWEHAIGPARVLGILDGLRRELGEERYRAAPALRRAAGPPAAR